MCDTIEPGGVLPGERVDYSEEKAAKASLPREEPECLECTRPKGLEYRP